MGEYQNRLKPQLLLDYSLGPKFVVALQAGLEAMIPGENLSLREYFYGVGGKLRNRTEWVLGIMKEEST